MLSGIFGYFFYQENEIAFFPLFGWLPYPVAGYFFARHLILQEDKKRFYGRLLIVSALIFVVYNAILVGCGFNPIDFFMEMEYYDQDVVKVLWMLLICIIWYSCLYFLSLLFHEGKATRFVTFLSRYQTAFYFSHWLAITWIVALFVNFVPEILEKRLGWMYFALCLMVFLIAAAVTFLWGRRTSSRQR